MIIIFYRKQSDLNLLNFETIPIELMYHIFNLSLTNKVSILEIS